MIVKKAIKKKINRQKKKDDLEKLMESLREKFGEGAIMKLGEMKKTDVSVVSTGSFSWIWRWASADSRRGESWKFWAGNER